MQSWLICEQLLISGEFNEFAYLSILSGLGKRNTALYS